MMTPSEMDPIWGATGCRKRETTDVTKTALTSQRFSDITISVNRWLSVEGRRCLILASTESTCDSQDAELGAIEQAMHRDHVVASRRPSLPEWIRDLVVAHASELLEVEVTRSALRHQPGGAPDWKRWRLARAVRRAAGRRRKRTKAS